MSELFDKLTSRKLWVSVAAMLAGVGATLAGACGGVDALAVAGAVCTALSAGIYAFAEAYVDASAAAGATRAAIDAETFAARLEAYTQADAEEVGGDD